MRPQHQSPGGAACSSPCWRDLWRQSRPGGARHCRCLGRATRNRPAGSARQDASSAHPTASIRRKHPVLQGGHRAPSLAKKSAAPGRETFRKWSRRQNPFPIHGCPLRRRSKAARWDRKQWMDRLHSAPWRQQEFRHPRRRQNKACKNVIIAVAIGIPAPPRRDLSCQQRWPDPIRFSRSWKSSGDG